MGCWTTEGRECETATGCGASILSLLELGLVMEVTVVEDGGGDGVGAVVGVGDGGDGGLVVVVLS